jgi:hypothetical protein
VKEDHRIKKFSKIFTKIILKLEFYTRNLGKSESNAAINNNKKGS